MTMSDEEWRQYMAESTKRQHESLAQVRARKDAILAERRTAEEMGLIRQQNFSAPMSFFGGRGFIEDLEKKSAERRKSYLAEHGADHIKARFPLTFKELWPGI